VNDQWGVGYEFEKIIDDTGEQRLVGEELARKPMHRECLGRHLALRVDVTVKGLTGWHAIENLDAADLNEAVAAQRIKAGGFGIENNFAHGPLAG